MPTKEEMKLYCNECESAKAGCYYSNKCKIPFDTPSEKMHRVPTPEFTVRYKKDRKEVDLNKMLKQRWTENLIPCDIDGFYLGADGQLILADECGNFAYVPQNGEILITMLIGTDIYEITY